MSTECKGYTTSPAQKAETSGRKLKSSGLDSKKILKLMKDKINNFNEKSNKGGQSAGQSSNSFEKNNPNKEKNSLYNAIRQVFGNNLKKKKTRNNESRETSEEKNNLGHITSNLINININNLIKDSVKNQTNSNSQDNLNKNELKTSNNEALINKSDRKLKNFFKKYGQENENVIN